VRLFLIRNLKTPLIIGWAKGKFCTAIFSAKFRQFFGRDIFHLNSDICSFVPVNQSNMMKNTKQMNEELLTPKEVAQMLKCDVKSIYNWTKKGILNRYSIASRVYYRKDEVLNALTKID
jgi:predicted DNA-binding transcriptional regulator AlpA